MKQLESHPAAQIFPMLDAESHAALRTDIQQNGQREDIVLLDGRILDGRNRYKACVEVGIEPQWCELEECADPVGYVLSKNLHRRHLDAAQRAMAAARARELYDAAAKERQKQGGRSAGRGRPKTAEQVPEQVPEAKFNGEARDAVGALFGVSGKSVDAASAVLEHGSDELIAAVESGKVAVTKAAKVAKASPKEIQMDEVNSKPKKPDKQKTPGALDDIKKLWKKLTDVERAAFMEWTEKN